MENYIQTEVKDGYAILTLTRPDAGNAVFPAKGQPDFRRR
ncbi:hypothetical protein SAMN05443582_11035 [Phyllobacterium sp. OV277]|nr:hypothetical protein SAMN05443582_11035 [Phyllobacterium sp. OV277]